MRQFVALNTMQSLAEGKLGHCHTQSGSLPHTEWVTATHRVGHCTNNILGLLTWHVWGGVVHVSAGPMVRSACDEGAHTQAPQGFSTSSSSCHAYHSLEHLH